VKLGCSSSSYDALIRSGKLELMAWVRACADELEVDGVEFLDAHFPTTDPIYLRDLKRLCTDGGLTIAGVAVTNDFGQDERRIPEIDRVRHWCDIAAYLGAPVVRVFAGTLPAHRPAAAQGVIVSALRKVFGGERVPDRRRLWSDVTWALRQCADHAAERGVTVALQNRRGGIVSTWQQLAQCTHDVGSPWLRICLDPAGIEEGPRYEDVLRSTVQVHARLRDVGDDGGDADVYWPELLRGLKAARYRGFVLMDYEGNADPAWAMPRATRYLRGVLQLLGRQQMLTAAADTNGASDAAIPAVFEALSELGGPPQAPSHPPRTAEEARLLEANRPR